MILIGLSIAAYFRKELEIPIAFWSVVFGSMIALAGVVIQNDAASERFERQLQVDNEQKVRERINKARMEVYIETADAFVSVSTYLGRLPDLDLSKEGLFDGLMPAWRATAKVQMVASDAVALQVSEVATSYARIAVMLFPKAIAIRDLNDEIQTADSIRNHAEREISDLRPLLDNVDLQRVGGGVDLPSLVQRHDRATAAIAAADSKKSALETDLVKARLAYLGEVLSLTDSMTQRTFTLLVSLRADLDVATGNHDVYLRKSYEMRDRFLAELNAITPILLERLGVQATELPAIIAPPKRP